VGNVIGAGHGGTYWEPNGGKAAAAVVAWLDGQLRGDERAKQAFVGESCGLCVDAAWKITGRSTERSAWGGQRRRERDRDARHRDGRSPSSFDLGPQGASVKLHHEVRGRSQRSLLRRLAPIARQQGFYLAGGAKAPAAAVLAGLQEEDPGLVGRRGARARARS
jgi:hypothetical protein